MRFHQMPPGALEKLLSSRFCRLRRKRLPFKWVTLQVEKLVSSGREIDHEFAVAVLHRQNSRSLTVSRMEGVRAAINGFSDRRALSARTSLFRRATSAPKIRRGGDLRNIQQSWREVDETHCFF